MAGRYSRPGVEGTGLTMSSGDPGDPADPKYVIELTAKQLETIFQVVHQLRNLPESRLVSAGSTAEDLEYLIAVITSMIDGLEGHATVRLGVSSDNLAELSTPHAPLVEEIEGASILSGILPWRVALQLRPLVEMAVSSLGPRELFLRTGFTFDEVREAMERLAVT
jgi:hypothetical protein